MRLGCDYMTFLEGMFGFGKKGTSNTENFIIKDTRNISAVDLNSIADLIVNTFKEYESGDPAFVKDSLYDTYLSLYGRAVSFTAYADERLVGFIHARRLDASSLALFGSAMSLAREWQTDTRSPKNDLELRFRNDGGELSRHLSSVGRETEGSEELSLEDADVELKEAFSEVLKLYVARKGKFKDDAEYSFLVHGKSLSFNYVSNTDYLKTVTVVDPLYRNKGIAAALNSRVETVLQEAEISHLFTYAIAGQGMYHVNLKRGFERVLSIEPFYKNGSAAVLMGKRL
ncbi:MAG: hypothetical protein A2912_01485 [Candidatus Buchananbacteria bacterium RIFCSPLOWO2_01_FULL_40_23b]|uniref:N-acetyltransferase domain-containing protein n=1 Tax=Candidatus Buchananbacteria bacterium RIFCSPLOWO2_01_FULL_40_23b TaxID=1797544 RepID=A0A1G1YUK7_9BACT|nr:MAG: hypothetical protein A2912_01485 [Candidatus Buchananbacteria bacterium RIFCSPLOWO2_01_FULL_40_23b]